MTTRWRCLFLSAHSTGVLSDVDLMVPTISLSVDSREDPAARCGFRCPGRGAGGWGSSIAHVALGAMGQSQRLLPCWTCGSSPGKDLSSRTRPGIRRGVERGGKGPRIRPTGRRGAQERGPVLGLSVAAWKGAIFAGQSEPAIGLRKENGPEECRRPRDGRSRARRRAGVARVVASGGCAPLRELSTVTARERGKAGSPWGGGMVDGACSPAPDPERPAVERQLRESAPGRGRSECPANTLLLQTESTGFRLGTRANPSQRGRGNREGTRMIALLFKRESSYDHY